MSLIEAVSFDMGDTLVDLGEHRGDYAERLLARAGRVYDRLAALTQQLPERAAFCQNLATTSEARYQARLAEQRALTIGEVLSDYCAGLGLVLDAGLLAECVDVYCQPASGGPRWRLGACDTLAELARRGLKLGILSNTIQPGRYLDRGLANAGMLDLFAARVYSSDVGYAKPHPQIFHALLAALGTRPERTVHVGDRMLADVAGARAVGMKAVLIRVPGRPDDRAGAGCAADACIDELPDLLAVLAAGL